MSVDASNATAAAGIDPSRARIAGAIKQAADTTGTSFEYLLATAKLESNFNPAAGASTSSAHGLYQFIEQTWLGPCLLQDRTRLPFALGVEIDLVAHQPYG